MFNNGIHSNYHPAVLHAFRELASGDHKQTYTFFLKREWGGVLIIVNALCIKKPLRDRKVI
jgi:hypothetical protein